MESQKKEGKAGEKKMTKTEKQVTILLIVLAAAFLAFIVTHYALKFLNPNPFDYEKFKVYKGRIEGINVDFYTIPAKRSDGSIVKIVIRNDPRETDGIEMNVNSNIFRNITQIWIAHSPDLESDAVISSSEIGSFINLVGLEAKYAFTKEGSKYNYDEMNCGNATSNTRVIEIRLENRTKVYSEGDCLIVAGEDYDRMIKASDKLIIEWLKRLALD